jgi:glycosyltransferase involved in cell wall biosynthesis
MNAGRADASMKVLLFANTDWYLFNFRLGLARALKKAGAEVIMISPDGPYGARLHAEGFRWIAVQMERRSLNPIRELRLLRQLAKLYREERPDVAHHFTIKCVVYGSLAARIAGIRRRINAVAGMGYVFTNPELRARVLRPLVRRLMKLALSGRESRLIVQNADDYAALENTVGGADRIHLIRGSGVDTRLFGPRLTVNTEKPLRLFFASRLLWDKGIAEYAAAARKLKAEGLSVEFLLAGAPDPGNPASVPPAFIRKWMDEGLVTALGHVEDMVTWLHQVHVAVLPSYREGVPKSLTEAAACGLPIITTDTPGCRDIVEHGVNGLLVPRGDAMALAEAIRFMYDHPQERLRMGAASRVRAVQEFAEDIVIPKTLQVYSELVPGAFQVRVI